MYVSYEQTNPSIYGETLFLNVFSFFLVFFFFTSQFLISYYSTN